MEIRLAELNGSKEVQDSGLKPLEGIFDSLNTFNHAAPFQFNPVAVKKSVPELAVGRQGRRQGFVEKGRQPLMGWNAKSPKQLYVPGISGGRWNITKMTNALEDVFQSAVNLSQKSSSRSFFPNRGFPSLDVLL